MVPPQAQSWFTVEAHFSQPCISSSWHTASAPLQAGLLQAWPKEEGEDGRDKAGEGFQNPAKELELSSRGSGEPWQVLEPRRTRKNWSLWEVTLDPSLLPQ